MKAKLFIFSLFFVFFTSPKNILAKKDLSELTELLNAEVISVSKVAEPAFDAPAAIYVLTKEDIKRSGATHIAEALRLVPGLQVANVRSSQWAISARGFNGTFANKLLVLIDGRTIYTPLFSGVYWNEHEVHLEDIKQIEVIRGPGATQWGANAVNGVINIITENAADTQGHSASIIYGDQEKANISYRYGGKARDGLFYRVYGKYVERNELTTITDNSSNDDWDSVSSGFRVDWIKSTKDSFNFQGDIRYSNQDLEQNLSDLPSNIRRSETLVAHGLNLMMKWSHIFDDGSEGKFHAYYDRSVRDYSIIDQIQNILDFDFQYAKNLNEIHNLVFGAGYRYMKDDLKGSFFLDFEPDNRSSNLFSAFIQDKIRLIDKKLYLTLGSKFEHNDFTGFEFQPSARIAWHPNERNTFWASVSRAVRTPSRAEDDIRFVVGKSGPVLLLQDGQRSFDSEDLIAYEIGYKFSPTNNFATDLTLFINDYSNVRTAEQGAVFFEGPKAFLPLLARNGGKGKTYGAEIAGEWNVTDYWKLKGSYSFLEIELDLKNNSLDHNFIDTENEDRSPENQLNIVSQLDLPYNIEFDNMLYFVDNLSDNNIGSYIRFDTRVGWKYNDNLRVDFIGQNLFDPLHPEFTSSFSPEVNQVPRSFYVKASLNF